MGLLMSEYMSVRSSVQDIIEKIFEAVADGELHSYTDLTHDTRLSPQTISKYVEIILQIQQRPVLKKIEKGNMILIQQTEKKE